MITIEVNNRRINAKPGELLLPVLKRSGITVPTLCNWEGLTPSGHCRLCVVEIESLPYLVPSCSTPVTEGMKVKTYSKKVQEAREVTLDLILANHPSDCVHCSNNSKCELQNIAAQFGSEKKLYKSAVKNHVLDDSGDALIRDLAKCVLCGRCIRICDELQTVHAIDWIDRNSNTHVGTSYDRNMRSSECLNCGQCIPACPTSALRIKSSIDKINTAIHDCEKHVVAIVHPSVTVTISEEFGSKTGIDASKFLNAALVNIGFDKVFDNAFASDLDVMEHSAMLTEKIINGNEEPVIKACSTSVQLFIEKHFPELINKISKCYPGEQIHGSLTKTYYADKYNINPDSIFTVAITPCTSAKADTAMDSHRRHSSERDYMKNTKSSHSERSEESREANFNENAGYKLVDAVLTPAELIKIIRMRGIDINSLLPENPSMPFDERSTAGMLAGVAGGFSEAVARTTYKMICGAEFELNEIAALRGTEGRKEAKISFKNGESFTVAVASGLKNVRALLTEIRNGRKDIDFIELNACPNGCISGGGEPVPYNTESLKRRMKSVYAIDRTETVRLSHKNRLITKIYNEFLDAPMSEKSRNLLYRND